MKPIYFHTDKDKGAPAEDTSCVLHSTGGICNQAHICAGIPNVVTVLCPQDSPHPPLPHAVKCVTGPAQEDSLFGDSLRGVSPLGGNLCELCSCLRFRKKEVGNVVAKVPH